MTGNVEFIQDLRSPGYVMRVLVNSMEVNMMEKIVDRGSRLFAAHLIRCHKKAILERIDYDMLSQKIAEQIAEKLK